MNKEQRLQKREILVAYENAIRRASAIRRQAVRQATEVFEKARIAAKAEMKQSLEELAQKTK